MKFYRINKTNKTLTNQKLKKINNKTEIQPKIQTKMRTLIKYHKNFKKKIYN